MLLQQRNQTVVNITGYADDCIFDGVLLLHVSTQIIRRHLQQAFLQPEDRIGQRVLTVSSSTHQLMDKIIRRVLAHGDFLQDYILLLGQLLGIHP